MSDPRLQPLRIADDPSAELRRLVAAAGTLAPPEGAQERIWSRLANPYVRLLDNADEDVVLVDLLRRSAVEPSAQKRETIWRRLNEEAAAHAGLAEPRRLLETEEIGAALLAHEASTEPPYARQGRLYRQLAPRRAFSWPRFAVATGALAACAILLFPIIRSSPVSGPLVATGGASGVSVGDAFALGTGETTKRWQFEGVGDCVLSGEGARLTVASSDARGVRLHLERGGVSIHAVKRAKDSPLVIEANGVEAQVVGTILAVEAIAGGANVFVREGLVQVTAPGKELALVGAGQSWPSPLNKPPQWADDNMSHLAGIAVARRAPLPAPDALVAPSAPVERSTPSEAIAAVAHADKRIVAEHPVMHQPELAPVVEPAMVPNTPVAPAPVPALRPGVAAATTTTTVVVETPAATPPSSVVAAAASHSLAGPHFNLDAEAKAFSTRTPEEINREIKRLQKDGPYAREALAGAYRALANAEDASEEQKAKAVHNLAVLLDDQMGAVEMAIKVRRELAPRLTGDDLSRARASILEDLVELNREEEIVVAAADCLKDCNAEQRLFALVLQPQFLMKEGRVEEAREATRLAQQEPLARTRTAFFFATRAESLQAVGQPERARIAALISLSLDPTGDSAAALRQKFK